MKAVIIGCGVAGPVVALALKRAGIEPVIYEAYPQGADYAGAFLTLASNGLNALRAIGEGEAVANASFPVERMVLRNHNGRILGVIPTLDGVAGSAMYTIKRRDLYRVLRDRAVAAGVEVQYGKRFKTVSESSQGVVAHFEDDTAAPGDILVGCDGLRSRVRSAIDENAPAPRYIPLLNTGGYARDASIPAEPATYEMYFGKEAFFAYLRSPDDTIYWFANTPAPAEPSAEVLASARSEQWKAHLLALLSDDRTPAARIVAGAPEIASPWPTYDIPAVKHWSSAKCVLVGDAAHAMSPSSGQGASMAIEDAIVLAKCLREFPIQEAFKRYEMQRRPRVERVVAYGARTSSGKAAGPVGRALRDFVMPLMLKRFGSMSALQWMYDYQIDWDEPSA